MVLYRRRNLAAAIKPIEFKTGTAKVKKDDKKESKDVNNKLVKIEKFFKSDLLASKKGAETKREDKEKDDFQKAEDKLETPKGRGFQLPSISASLPNLGFLDRVKRFIFFTALGWLFPKLLEFMPRLRGIGNIIATVITFAGKIFSSLSDGFVSLVKFGGDLKTKTLGFISTIPGANNPTFQSTFKSLQDNFDTFVNAAIISSVLAGDIGLTIADELAKLKRERAAISAAKKGGEAAATAATRGATSAARSYNAGKSGITASTSGATRAAGNFKLNQQRQLLTRQASITPPTKRPWWQKIIPEFKTPAWIEKLLTKFKTGPLKRLAGPFSKFLGKAVPFVGAVVSELDAQERFKRGEVIGGWLARAGAILDGFAAGAAIAGLPFVASLIGAPIGGLIEIIAGVATALSIGIDVILLIHDILEVFGVKTFSRGGRVVGGYQGGGNVSTRGGRDTNAPVSRTLTPETSRILPIQRPPKPPASKPGKDVGGVKKLNRLYPDPESSRSSLYEVLSSGENREISLTDIANPYKSLTSSAKIAKTIPLIGGVMGAAIDLSLGERPSRNVLKSLTMGMGSVIDSFIDQKVNTTIASLSREIMKFSDGGLVKFEGLKKVYNSMRSGELLYKIIGPVLMQKSNEIIQLIKKEIDKKFPVNAGAPGSDSQGESGSPAPGATLGGVAVNVNPDEIIGKVGDTGVSEGAHIHIEDEDTPGGPIPDSVKKNILVSGRPMTSGVRTSPVGYRIHPRYGVLKYHSGEDWDNGWENQPISLTGGLKFVKYIPMNSDNRHYGYGNVVVIEDTSGNRYFLGHLNSGPQNLQALIQRQQQVQQQQAQQQQSSQTPGSVNTTTLTPNGRTIMGEASFYADQFQGNRTSTGEIFDYNKLTAAMSRPGWNPNPGVGGSGSYWVEVTNLANGKKVRVKVNDSGPFEPNSLTPHRTRVIDLSKAAFAKIASVSAGIINVKVERLSGTPTIVPNPTTPPGAPSPSPGSGSSGTGTGTSPGSSPTNRTGYPSAPQLPPPPGPLGIIVKSTKLPDGSVVTIRKNQIDGKLNYTLNGTPLTTKQIEDLRKKYPAAFTPPAPPDAVSGLLDGLLGALERPAGQTQAPRSSPKTEVYRALSKKDWIDFTNKGKKYRFKVIMSGNNYEFKLEEKVIDMNLFGANIEKYDPRSITPDLKNAIEEHIRKIYKFKSGGLVQPTKSRLPIPNSYASYESPSGYNSEVAVAIQPIIITKQMPMPSNSKESLIVFPVPVEVNTNMDIAYNRSRGY